MDPTILAAGIVILLFSVIVHEVMHGVAALYFGDHTAERAGRLTLNPIPHIDPIGTILIPGLLLISGAPIMFGWAKPVPINPLNFSDIRKGELVTSAAGVLANFLIALLGAGVFHLLPLTSSMQSLLSFTVHINLVLAIFNLIPLPPLDGSKIVMSFLPTKLAAQYASLERYGFLLILLLWFIPVEGTSLLSFILEFFLNIFKTLLRV